MELSLAFTWAWAIIYRTAMQSTEEKPTLKCDHIVMAQRGIAEVHGRKTILFVPAEEITRIKLRFGRPEHRPMVSISIGLILAVTGVWGVYLFFAGNKGNRYYLGLVAIGIIGGSLIFDALKQRYFLEVENKKGMCRLVFSKDVKSGDIADFCNKIKTSYNYEVIDEIRQG